jgi:hypothetical protein
MRRQNGRHSWRATEKEITVYLCKVELAQQLPLYWPWTFMMRKLPCEKTMKCNRAEAKPESIVELLYTSQFHYETDGLAMSALKLTLLKVQILEWQLAISPCMSKKSHLKAVHQEQCRECLVGHHALSVFDAFSDRTQEISVAPSGCYGKWDTLLPVPCVLQASECHCSNRMPQRGVDWRCMIQHW